MYEFKSLDRWHRQLTTNYQGVIYHVAQVSHVRFKESGSDFNVVLSFKNGSEFIVAVPNQEAALTATRLFGQ